MCCMMNKVHVSLRFCDNDANILLAVKIPLDDQSFNLSVRIGTFHLSSFRYRVSPQLLKKIQHSEDICAYHHYQGTIFSYSTLVILLKMSYYHTDLQ